MVFLSKVRLVKSRGPDRYWRRKIIFDQTQHFYGRRRNCFRVARNALYKSWQHTTRSRIVQRRDIKRLWMVRMNAGAREHDMKYSQFVRYLNEYDIAINRNMMASVACFEPKTFKCLVELARKKQSEGILAAVTKNPDRVLNRLQTQEDLLSDAVKKLRINASKSS